MDFKPTWLYVKQHNITGLKYFGKTTKKDPIKYLGSGVYWRRHLNEHGENISTIWSQLFTDQQSLVLFALTFSQENNIVKSKEWANLRPEDGLMGGDTGITAAGRLIISEKSKKQRHSEETKQKIKKARALQSPTMLGKCHSEETKQKIKTKRALQIMPTGRKLSEESKRKIAESQRLRHSLKGKV